MGQYSCKKKKKEREREKKKERRIKQTGEVPMYSSSSCPQRLVYENCLISHICSTCVVKRLSVVMFLRKSHLTTTLGHWRTRCSHACRWSLSPPRKTSSRCWRMTTKSCASRPSWWVSWTVSIVYEVFMVSRCYCGCQSWCVSATEVVSHGESALLRLSVMVSQCCWGCQSWWVSATEVVSHGESVLLRLSVMVSQCCWGCRSWWVGAVQIVMKSQCCWSCLGESVLLPTSWSLLLKLVSP